MNKKILLMLSLAVFMAMLLMTNPVKAGDVHITFDSGSGTTTITTVGKDATTWHPNQVGEVNTFTYSGDVKGTYDSEEGVYGRVNTWIHAYTDSGGGSFFVQDYQDFDVLSANIIYGFEGYYEAWASGSYAEMNMKFIGHSTGFQEATDPYWQEALIGSNIGKYAEVNQSGVLQGKIYFEVVTNETAWMKQPQSWGWSISGSSVGQVSTEYSGYIDPREIYATGSGMFIESGYGKDYLEFENKVFLSGGTYSATGVFNDGMSGTYHLLGN